MLAVLCCWLIHALNLKILNPKTLNLSLIAIDFQMAHKKMTEELTKNDSAPIGIIFLTTVCATLSWMFRTTVASKDIFLFVNLVETSRKAYYKEFKKV